MNLNIAEASSRSLKFMYIYNMKHILSWTNISAKKIWYEGTLTFTPTMDWKPYIQSIAKAASRKVGSLFRAQPFLSPESILYLYKSTIRPCMEYCSHIWGGAHMSKGLDLLDRVQKRVVNLVGKELCAGLHTLSHRRNVAEVLLS